MKITVLLSSGDEDVWESKTLNTLEGEGLVVVEEPTEEEFDRKSVKLLEVTTEREQRPISGGYAAALPQTSTVVWKVLAIYAPGMWMKVEFE